MAIFTNRATLTYNNESINSNTVVGEIVEVLAVTKTAVGGEYAPGGTVTYVVSIVNSGTTPFTGLTVTDDLGGYTFGTQTLYPLTYVDASTLYYINGALQASPAVNAGPPLVFSGINVPALGNATIIYQARVNEYAPADVGGSITNTVNVAGGGIGEDVSDTSTVTTETRARLSITKALEPETVNPNGAVTYTFTIENTGNVPAEGTVVISDIFDPVLSAVTATYNGAPWTANTDYTYNATSGAFASVPGAITVPAATFTQDPATGIWTVTPGSAVITVTGNV